MTTKNCVVVRWVKDARGMTQPAFWRGVRNEWVLEYPDAHLLSRGEAKKAAKTLNAEAFEDWGLDTERVIVMQQTTEDADRVSFGSPMFNRDGGQ